MSTTVAQIAETAFNNVAAAITDAVKNVSVTRTTRGVYNTTTGAYAETYGREFGKAVLDTVRPVSDIFPQYKVGPKDQLWLVRGVGSIQEGDAIKFAPAEALALEDGSRILQEDEGAFFLEGQVETPDYYAKAVQDIVGAGSLFYVVVQ